MTPRGPVGERSLVSRRFALVSHFVLHADRRLDSELVVALATATERGTEPEHWPVSKLGLVGLGDIGLFGALLVIESKYVRAAITRRRWRRVTGQSVQAGHIAISRTWPRIIRARL